MQMPESRRLIQSAGLVATLFAAGLLGCRRSDPIEEISVESSGIELRDLGVAEDAVWPSWRGPSHNGIAQTQPLATQWSDSTCKWKVDVPGRGHGSPIVVGELVLLASALEEQQEQVVLAYSRDSGELVWETTVHSGGFPSAREIHKKGTNANSTLASDGEFVYIAFFNSGKITATAIDLEGEIAWSNEIGSFRSKFGFAPSPVLYKSFVIVAADHQGGGFLAALDRESGEIAWRTSRPAINSHSTPLVANVGGKDQLLISGCDTVSSYDPATGDENWSRSGTSATTCSTIVVEGERIFASGGYPDKQTLCLDPSGEVLWDHKTAVYEPSMLVAGENLFAVTDRGIAYCWSAQTGEERWKKRLGGNFSASPILCNGLIYVSSDKGETFVFKESGDSYQEVATNQLGTDCYASPAVADSQLFIRVGTGGAQRQEKLCCIAAPEA